MFPRPPRLRCAVFAALALASAPSQAADATPQDACRIVSPWFEPTPSTPLSPDRARFPGGARRFQPVATPCPGGADRFDV